MRVRLTLLVALAATSLALSFATPAGAQDAAAGEQGFRRCAACHSVGPDAAHKVGPQLNGIMGQPAARFTDYNYSPALRRAAEGGLVWTEATMADFLKDARSTIPGTSMSYAPMRSDADVADIIAYLITLSPDFRPASSSAPRKPTGSPPLQRQVS